ncbi:MAG TPA: hypothetical protein VGA20_11650 [Gemmatimonadales bacterium]
MANPLVAVRPQVSDRDLVSAVAAGDRAAFQELRLRYGATAYAVAYSVVVDPEQAEAAVSDAFAVARVQAGELLARGASVARWICQLTREASSRFRAQS